MYRVICYYEDSFFGECSYVYKDNLTLDEADACAKERENTGDIYRVEKQQWNISFMLYSFYLLR